jgi:hypothetical protein
MNPGGRPKGGSPREALRSFAGKAASEIKVKTFAEAIAVNMLTAAADVCNDRIPAAKLVIDNIDGPVKQELELSGTFVVEAPARLSREEWMAKYVAAAEPR